MLLISLDQRCHLGKLRGIDLALSCNEWKAHEDIGSGQVFSSQPLASVRRSLQLLLKESEMCVVVAVQELIFDAPSNCASNWLDEEGNWGILDLCERISK